MSECKRQCPRVAGSHLEWEFTQNVIESLAGDGHPLRWPLSFLASDFFIIALYIFLSRVTNRTLPPFASRLLSRSSRYAD